MQHLGLSGLSLGQKSNALHAGGWIVIGGFGGLFS
jgi:hypothetical protein